MVSRHFVNRSAVVLRSLCRFLTHKYALGSSCFMHDMEAAVLVFLVAFCLDLTCCFDHAAIVTEYIGWSLQGYAKEPQFDTEDLDMLNCCSHSN